MPASREILVIHPDSRARSALGLLLEDLGYVVHLEERVPGRGSRPPRLGLVELPPGTAVGLVQEFRQIFPEPRLIVLLREPSIPQLLALFPHAVDRCFSEPVKVEQILAAIRELTPVEPELREGIVPAQDMSGTVRPYARPTHGPGSEATSGTPLRLFGLPEEERFLDPLDRRLADYKGFRGPLALFAGDRECAERAARKLGRLASNREPVFIEPVGLSVVRRACAEGRNEAIWIVRSPEVIPPTDRQWLAQMAGGRGTETPRIVLPFGHNQPDWLRATNISTLRLPASADKTHEK